MVSLIQTEQFEREIFAKLVGLLPIVVGTPCKNKIGSIVNVTLFLKYNDINSSHILCETIPMKLLKQHPTCKVHFLMYKLFCVEYSSPF